MPSYPPVVRRVGADPTTPINWLTLNEVKQFGLMVDAQFNAVDADVNHAASVLGDKWSLREGTAWFDLLHEWRAFNADLQDLWFTFGLQTKWALIESYQKQAKEWQEKISAMTGTAPTGAPIVPVEGPPPLFSAPSTPTLVVAGLAAAALLVWAIKK